MSEKATILHGDCIEKMRELDDNSVDSIVTDPPYGLGFMGKKWDALPPSLGVFEEALRVLRPGGHLLAFGGSRTYHRLAVAVEDAGFEIRDQIQWVYGSGFPKSRNVGKEVDAFDGWGTALKPAHEPIVMARKPLPDSVARNVRKHGTGALNIDGCRVGWPDGKAPLIGTPGWGGPAKTLSAAPGQIGETVERSKPNQQGRFPANLIHDGSEEVMGVFPDAGGQQGSITGNEPSGKMGAANCYGKMDRRHESAPRIDSSKSAARFFYCAKASKADRTESGEVENNHPTVKPTELMRYLVRLVTPPGGVVLDPFMGSGSTGKAAMLEGLRFIGIDFDEESVELSRLRITEAAELKPQMGLPLGEGEGAA